MKRIVAVLLAFSLMLLSGCGVVKKQEYKKLIAVSFYPVYIFTINLTHGIDGLEVQSVGEQNTGCLHDYTITAKDAKLLSDAAVLIVNGAGMEGFLEDLYSANEKLAIVDSSKGAHVICSEHHHHHHDEETDVEMQYLSHVSFNSHIWMSVENAKTQVYNIKRGLVEAFPEYEGEINHNYELYISRLSILAQEIADAKEGVKDIKVFAFHNAYEYMSEDFGFDITETIETDEGGEPSAKQLGQLSVKAKEENINAIFVEPYYTGTSAEIISRETGVKVYTLNPVTSGEKTKTAYEDIMRENIKVLKAVK